LSHHQHKDNFDHKGRAFTNTVPRVISTKPASKILKNTIGLDDWETTTIETGKLSNLSITATPAQHRPWWIPQFFIGKVIGFVIEFDEQEDGVIYISGDTVYFNGIDEVAKRYKINIGILHVGSAQFPHLSGTAKYTMDGKDFIEATRILNPKKAIPIHHKGWTHFKEAETALLNTIKQNKIIMDKTILLTSGKRTEL